MPSKTTREGFSNRDALSRTGMIYGTAGTDAQGQTDTWYDLDTFLQDQVHEVLEKLDEGSLDDEIWGKIVIMEKGKRVAKAYLRKTTVIIDGSTDNFDGKTLGFNAFDNPSRDEHTEEIKNKIGDGVILKMDYQGNIKGMARGMSPVICQGWKENEKKYNCVSDRLTKLQGRLNCSEEGKTFKIFDMKRFKSALERELSEGRPDAKTLMLKTAVRVALVKDGGEIVRTPCWFTIVNLVALDMLKSKIPNIRTLAARDYSNIFQSLACQQPIYSTSNYSSKDHYAASPINPEVLNAQALTQILAAAVKQANNNQPLSQSLNNLPVSVDQLAQLASTLSMVKTEAPPSKQEFKERDQIKKDRRRSCKIPSDDSSGEDSAMRSDSTQSGTRTRNKRWDQTTKSMDVIHQVPKKKSPETQRRGLHRPRLQDVLFDRSYSTTSDYDSNREVFDSGSWSSHGSQSYQERSSSSYIVSDAETAKLKAKTKGPPPPTPAKPTKKGGEMNNPVNSTALSDKKFLHQRTSRNLNSNTLDATSVNTYNSRGYPYSDDSRRSNLEGEKIYSNPNALMEFSRNAVVVEQHSIDHRDDTMDRIDTPILDDCTIPEEGSDSFHIAPNQTFDSQTAPNNALSIAITDDEDRHTQSSPEDRLPLSHQRKHSVAAAYQEEHSAHALVCGRTQKGSSQKELVQRHAAAPAESNGKQTKQPNSRREAAESQQHPDVPAAVPLTPKTGNHTYSSASVRSRLFGAWDSLVRRRQKTRTTQSTASQLFNWFATPREQCVEERRPQTTQPAHGTMGYGKVCRSSPARPSSQQHNQYRQGCPVPPLPGAPPRLPARSVPYHKSPMVRTPSLATYTSQQGTYVTRLSVAP